MTPLDHARAYAALGWRVIPVRPGFKYPKGYDEWQIDATTDDATITQWWTAKPDHGISIATGIESGIFVVDVDPRHGGDETLADLEFANTPLPDTVETITGGGGRHIYFAMPDTVITNDAGKKLGIGLDVRGEGGQVVAPPTVHPDTGARYEWEALSDPLEGTTVAQAPEWLVRMLSADVGTAEPRRKPAVGTIVGDRPGDRFEAATDWPDLLQRDGWTLHSPRRGRSGDYELWTRPGKEPRDGASASLYYQGSDVLKVFTSSMEPKLAAERTYDRFGYWAAMHHGGDLSAAAREAGRLYPSEARLQIEGSRPAHVCPSCGSTNTKETT